MTLLRTISADNYRYSAGGGVSTGITMIENGSNPLPDRYVKVISSVFGVNEAWLRMGDGDTFYSSPYEKEFTEIFGSLVLATQPYLLLMARELLATQDRLLNPPTEQQSCSSESGE